MIGGSLIKICKKSKNILLQKGDFTRPLFLSLHIKWSPGFFCTVCFVSFRFKFTVGNYKTVAVY